MARIRVYYNSACPVCNAGIKGQQERMRDCPAAVDWIDIHSNGDAVREIGAQREFVRERLHVVDEKGELRIGSEAFAALWSQTRGQRWLARLVSIPGVNALTRWAYNVFARALYAWNRRHQRWRVE